MSNGSKIAAQIERALIEAATAVGDGPLVAVLERAGEVTGTPSRPIYGDPTYHDVYVLSDTIKVKDEAGNLTGETQRMLTMSATGVRPGKGDRIKIDDDWFEIDQVMPLEPGGVALLYELLLVT